MAYKISGNVKKTFKISGSLNDYLSEAEATGAFITLGDSVQRKLLDFELFGKSVQAQLTGKNLFDADNANILNAYITNTIVMANNHKTIYIPCEPNTVYTVTKAVTNRFVMGFTDELPASGVAVSNKVVGYSAKYLTSTSGESSQYLCAWIYMTDDGYVLEDVLKSIQIEKGSTATDYEPYCGGIPSPNPDYPQDIQSLESPKVTACGKNLFNKASANIVYGYIGDGILVGHISHVIVYIPCEPNVTYSASKNRFSTNDRFGIAWSKELPVRGTSLYGVNLAPYAGTVIGEKLKLKCTTGEGAKYVVVWACWSTEINSLNSLQVEIDNTASDYEPYKGNTATLPGIVLRATPDGTRDRLVKVGGLWKIESNCGYISSYAGELITTSYYSSTGELSTGATVIYVLATPTYETLPDSVQEELNALESYNHVTNIFTDSELAPDMRVRYTKL